MIVYLKYVEVEPICQPIKSPEITRKQDGYHWGGHWTRMGFTKKVHCGTLNSFPNTDKTQTHTKDNISCSLHIGQQA